MIDDCITIKFPIIEENRGNLTFIENSNHIPFDIKRVYYLSDIPKGSERGGHAHKKLKQIIIAVSGSFDVVIDDGSNQKTINLCQPNEGLLIVPMIWRELKNFSMGSVCLVLASDFFLESDYYRDKENFIEDKRIK
jgi:dTDP-4-dehydrorhamnose 3,5-epimerase-like enzyme